VPSFVPRAQQAKRVELPAHLRRCVPLHSVPLAPPLPVRCLLHRRPVVAALASGEMVSAVDEVVRM
jgi:hypothetical protein